jgi:c-di-GMP-binding flagellar brake protein YcgR
MTSNDSNQFELITSQRDRERILAEISVKGTVVILQTDDRQNYAFRVLELAGNKLALNPHPRPSTPVQNPTRELKKGESVEVLFGLNDGQYLMRLPVVQSIEPSVVLELVGEIHRLQRRANFRTIIPTNERVFYRLAGTAGSKPVDLTCVDLSAGGMRVRWPESGAPSPTPNSEWNGVLHVTDGRTIETRAVIRNVFPTDGAYALVGMEFQGLPTRDQQTLVFVCMQMFRAVSSRNKH